MKLILIKKEEKERNILEVEKDLDIYIVQNQEMQIGIKIVN